MASIRKKITASGIGRQLSFSASRRGVERLTRDRYKQAVLLLFVLFLIASCIAPPYPQYLLMQHAPTVVAAVAFACFSNRFAMSRGSFSAVIVFLALHTVGCR